MRRARRRWSMASKRYCAAHATAQFVGTSISSERRTETLCVESASPTAIEPHAPAKRGIGHHVPLRSGALWHARKALGGAALISFRPVLVGLVVAVAAAAACGGDVADQGNGLPDSSTDSPSSTADTSTGNGDSSANPDTSSTTVTPIPCGMGACDPSTQFCCIIFQPASQMCLATGSPCMGAALSCTSASSCTSGDVCCADIMGTKVSSSCKPKCAGGFMEPQLCASSAECTPPDTCRMILGGYKACAPPQPDGGFPPPKDGGGVPKDAGPG